MTRGPGRSDCYRVGVTYGYREYLRKGRVRVKAAPQVRRPDGLTNLRWALNQLNH